MFLLWSLLWNEEGPWNLIERQTGTHDGIRRA
jgi:hypothetical protein